MKTLLNALVLAFDDAVEPSTRFALAFPLPSGAPSYAAPVDDTEVSNADPD